MIWFVFILASLTCFRLSRLFAEDEIMSALRSFAVQESPRSIKRKVKQGISCPFCWSFWISGIITVYLLYFGMIGAIGIALLWGGIWGMSVLLNQVFVFLSK